MYRVSPFKEYFADLRTRTLRISIVVTFITIFCMTFGIDNFYLSGYEIPLPYPGPTKNIATQLIHTMNENLLPKSVKLIQVTPQGAFVTQIYVAGLLGIILAIPLVVREVVGFVGPALYQSEKAIIKKVALPSIVLFTTGCLFSYFIVIPYTVDFLYKYGESIGVNTFFNISEFIPFIMQFLLIFGFSYQLPIIMCAITQFKIVKPMFWRNNPSYVIILIVIFAAVITPDGSGITMWFVAAPMLLLYLLGMMFTKWQIKS
jgi:sec-independent protein translocase protein TatC